LAALQVVVVSSHSKHARFDEESPSLYLIVVHLIFPAGPSTYTFREPCQPAAVPSQPRFLARGPQRAPVQGPRRRSHCGRLAGMSGSFTPALPAPPHSIGAAADALERILSICTASAESPGESAGAVVWVPAQPGAPGRGHL
jgi:hypothetical protein